MSIIAYVGIDAHENSLSICAYTKFGDEPVYVQNISNEKSRVVSCFSRLAKEFELYCCYEASGLGYVLHRWLTELGISCSVIAPSLIPTRPGDHVKTDKRDARELAKLFRSGHLTSVVIPSEEQEHARTLVRLRGSFVRDVVSWKNQANKFLTSRHIQWPGKARWTLKHWRWLRSLKFSETEDFVWSEMIAMLEYKTSRLEEIDKRICDYAQREPYREKVARLSCFRGIATLTAMTLLTEIIDFNRFKSPKALMSYLGIVPGEFSSGQSRHQTKITKAGNSRCRVALVEAAWKYERRPSRSQDLIRRQAGAPAWVINHSWKAQHRLYKRFHALVHNGKPRPKAVVAIARELVGFIWSVMVTPSAVPTKAAASI